MNTSQNMMCISVSVPWESQGVFISVSIIYPWDRIFSLQTGKRRKDQIWYLVFVIMKLHKQIFLTSYQSMITNLIIM